VRSMKLLATVSESRAEQVVTSHHAADPHQHRHSLSPAFIMFALGGFHHFPGFPAADNALHCSTNWTSLLTW